MGAAGSLTPGRGSCKWLSLFGIAMNCYKTQTMCSIPKVLGARKNGNSWSHLNNRDFKRPKQSKGHFGWGVQGPESNEIEWSYWTGAINWFNGLESLDESPRPKSGKSRQNLGARFLQQVPAGSHNMKELLIFNKKKSRLLYRHVCPHFYFCNPHKQLKGRDFNTFIFGLSKA
jgi:hypothetical protein